MIPTKYNQEEVLAEKRRKENEAALYGLSDDLLEKGYRYDDTGVYIPYPDKDNAEFYLKISRNNSKKQELIYTWVKREENNIHELLFHRSNKLISEVDTKLGKNLIEAGEISGVPVDEDTLEMCIKDFKAAIVKSHRLEILKDLNFEFQSSPEEINEPVEEQEIEEKFNFNSYPRIIREEALRIIDDGSLYEKYLDSISITHAGNNTTKEQLALITVSLFIGEPTHTEINATTGQGKTDVTTETVKNIPECYIHHLSTVSPKNIYYDRDSYGEFNIVIFDDVVLTDENIGLLKVLTDNNKPVKDLKTVIDKKAVTFTLPGRFLVIITYAKDNPDEELLNRLYKLNMNIDEDSKLIIKNKIKYNTIINSENNEIINRSRLIIQAAIQYLIEQEIEIFNPFAVLFDPTLLENRNIKHFISMVKSKSFFHTNILQKINFAGKTIYIGSYEDFKYVAEIWSNEADTQKYKLNDKEKKVLTILPEKTREEVIEEIENVLDEYIATTPVEQADILDKLFTRKTISKHIGVSEGTVRNYLDRSQGTSKSLVDIGLIGRLRFNAEIDNSPWVYYKVKNEDKKTSWHDWQIENAMHFDRFECKIRILLSFLYLANITINEKGYFYLKNYCENKNNIIDVNDYNSYYNFINNALTNFDLKKYSVKIENARLSELKYMTDLFSFQENDDEKNEDNSEDQNFAIFAKQVKVEESNPNDNLAPIFGGNPDLPGTAKLQDSEIIFGSDINHPDNAFKVCNLLINRNLTGTELYDKIYTNVDMSDPDSEFYCSMEFKEELHHLEMGHYISKYSNKKGETCYQLSDNLKKLLAGTERIARNDVEIFESDLLMADYGFKLFDL